MFALILLCHKKMKKEKLREKAIFRLAEGFCGKNCQTDSWGSTALGQTMRDVILDQAVETSALE